MSNINNHGVGVNKINFTADFQELTCEQAATIQGGAELHVFEDENFSGPNSIYNEDVGLVGIFNDRISSVKVYSGEWTLWSDADFSGSGLILGPGEYNLTGGVYHDTISSVQRTVK
jgi:hypothetical protein